MHHCQLRRLGEAAERLKADDASRESELCEAADVASFMGAARMLHLSL